MESQPVRTCLHAFQDGATGRIRSHDLRSNDGRSGCVCDEACVVSSSSEENMVFANLEPEEHPVVPVRMPRENCVASPREKQTCKNDVWNVQVRSDLLHSKRHEKKKERDRKRKKKTKEKKLKRRRRKKKRKKSNKQRRGSSSSSTSSSLSSLTPASELAEALAHDKIFLAKYLIDKHGVHLYNSDRESPLHCAARQNKPKFVSWFITLPGAAEVLDIQNAKGETALLVATKLLHGTIALRLIEALADPGAIDNEGSAPEALGLDALLRKAEAVEVRLQNMDNATAFQEPSPSVQQQTASRQSRDDAEWGRRLFSEMMEDEFHITHEVFAGYEDLERQDDADDSWMDDIAFQYQEREQREARALTEERMRVLIEAREQARRQADAQEARARLEAQRRAASDAEFQKRWRQSQSSEEFPKASPPLRGDRGKKHCKTCIATRAEDDARWRAFEDRIQQLHAATGASPASHAIYYRDIPWPSGPHGNPLHIDPSGHPAVLRSQIRAGLLRWHPDKFDQRVGRFLPPEGDEREKAVARVKELAQQLNRMMTELVTNSSGAASQSCAA